MIPMFYQQTCYQGFLNTDIMSYTFQEAMYSEIPPERLPDSWTVHWWLQ